MIHHGYIRYQTEPWIWCFVYTAHRLVSTVSIWLYTAVCVHRRRHVEHFWGSLREGERRWEHERASYLL